MPSKSPSTLRLRRQRGSATIEMAAVLPLLLLVLFGVMDFGRLLFGASAVTHAARTGAGYGAASVGKSADTTGMQNAATAAAGDIAPLTSAVGQQVCECPNGTVLTCSDPSPPCRKLIFAQVTVTKNFSGFSSFTGLNGLTVTRTAKIRAK